MKGYRTLAFNLVSGLIATATGLLEYAGVLDLSPIWIIAAIIVVNLGNAYLRSITDSPMGKKF
jgi:hypothetical protein